jgi:hypothetical protein
MEHVHQDELGCCIRDMQRLPVLSVALWTDYCCQIHSYACDIGADRRVGQCLSTRQGLVASANSPSSSKSQERGVG